jgi:hypothetical protein
MNLVSQHAASQDSPTTRSGRPARARPAPAHRATPRHFPARYKIGILAEYDTLDRPGHRAHHPPGHRRAPLSRDRDVIRPRRDPGRYAFILRGNSPRTRPASKPRGAAHAAEAEREQLRAELDQRPQAQREPGS